jgi:hypothetical protein
MILSLVLVMESDRYVRSVRLEDGKSRAISSVTVLLVFREHSGHPRFSRSFIIIQTRAYVWSFSGLSDNAIDGLFRNKKMHFATKIIVHIVSAGGPSTPSTVYGTVLYSSLWTIYCV